MTDTLLVKLDLESADPELPLISVDPATIDGARLFAFDFGLAETFDGGVLPADGATLTNGTEFNNLVPIATGGGAVGSLSGSTTYELSGSAGSLALSSAAVFVKGASGAAFDPAGMHSLLYSVWLEKTDVSPENAFAFGRAGQFEAFSTGTAIDDDHPWGIWLNNAERAALIPAVGTLAGEDVMPVGEIRMVSIAVERFAGQNGARVRAWTNAELRGEDALSGLASASLFAIAVQTGGNTGFSFGGGHPGFNLAPIRLYREALWDLALIPEADPAAMVAAQWAAHHARFGI